MKIQTAIAIVGLSLASGLGRTGAPPHAARPCLLDPQQAGTDRVVLVRPTGQVSLTNSITAQTTVLPGPDGGSASSETRPTLAPSGDAVVLGARVKRNGAWQEGLWRIGVHDGQWHLLKVVAADHPAFSPDGEHIAFTRLRVFPFPSHGFAQSYDVWVMNADGSRARKVIADALEPRWSTDGRYLAAEPAREVREKLPNGQWVWSRKDVTGLIAVDTTMWARIDGVRLLDCGMKAPSAIERSVPALDGCPTLLTKWGSEGRSDGQFGAPLGIAADTSGQVFVADTANRRIQKFTSDGSFLLAWRTSGRRNGGPAREEPAGGTTRPFEPLAIAADDQGNVYVTDTAQVQKYDSNGQFVTAWGEFAGGNGEFKGPAGVAVDHGGGVYIIDRGNFRIQKFTGDGTFLLAWGHRGSGDGELSDPWRIAVDSRELVYVIDRHPSRLQVFTDKGAFLRTVTLPPCRDRTVSEPKGVAADGRENVYVVDGGGCIEKFGSDGTLLTTWGRRGIGDGGFSNPQGIAVDGSGSVYVVEFIGRVQKFACP